MNTSYKRFLESDRIREEVILDVSEKRGNQYNGVTNVPYKITINSTDFNTNISIKVGNKIALHKVDIEDLLKMISQISNDSVITDLREHTYVNPFASTRVKGVIETLEAIGKLVRGEE